MKGPERKCPHYWIIDRQNVGRCRYCGTVRNFNTQMKARGWSWPRLDV